MNFFTEIIHFGAKNMMTRHWRILQRDGLQSTPVEYQERIVPKVTKKNSDLVVYDMVRKDFK